VYEQIAAKPLAADSGSANFHQPGNFALILV